MTNTNKVTDINAGRAREINRLHKSGVAMAIQIGELLTQVQDSLQHGEWGRWQSDNLEFSVSTANNYMRAYEGSKLVPATSLPEPKTIKEAAARAPSQRKARTKKTPVMAASDKLAEAGEPPLSVEEYASLRNKTKLREQAIGEGVNLKKLTEEEAEKKAESIVEAIRQKRVDDAPTVTRADLSLTMQQKFDKALAKALAEQKAAQEKTYWTDVNAKALEMMPERMRQIEERNRVTQRDINALRSGPGRFMAKDDFRKLRSMLHRVINTNTPPTVEECRDGFDFVQKLDPYMKAATGPITLK